MTKQEFLDKYGDQVLFETKFIVNDLVSSIPDDAIIKESNIQMALRYLGKGLEEGIMFDWTVVADTAVSGSGLLEDTHER